MNFLKKLKTKIYLKEFKHQYSLLTDDEKEVIQLLLISPRTSCQLRNKGFDNPDTIINHLRLKGWSISVTCYPDGERTFKFEGENPWN